MLRVGLVGAGPWAELFHAPMISESPETTLVSVWARRPEAAASLAAAHGATALSSYDELLESCDVVAFAVPPDVQAELAPRAALAGRHLVLEKPLAFTVEGAERIAAAVEEAGVRTVLMLRNRFTEHGRRFVESARRSAARGGQATFVTGAALPGNEFATPWRVERGALFDLGPHTLDLLDAAMGTIEEVTATGDPVRWVSLVTRHEGGGIGQVSLSITTPRLEREELRVEVFTELGAVLFDGQVSDADAGVGDALMAELASAVSTGRPSEIDVRRGLHLQRLIAQAEAGLA
jgi:predicted dehydrogenase